MPSAVAIVTKPTNRPRSWLAAFYPAVWRWHFWAGLLISPVLIVVAITGALYVFKEELSLLTQPELLCAEVPRGANARSLGERLTAARARLGDGWVLTALRRSAEPARADEFTFESEPHDSDSASEHEHRVIYVDPYTAAVLGDALAEGDFFAVVLKIHRTLLAGAVGRVLVEVATCWGLISLLTGLLLWWPRGREKLWGVWLPRLRKGGKIALRDLHTIPGLYLFAAVFTILFTGLIYTSVWGRVFFAGLYVGGQLPAPYVSPPKSTPLAAGAVPANIDQIVAEARTHYPFREFSLLAPREDGQCWTLYGPTQTGDFKDGVIYLDASTGRTLAAIDYAKLKGGAKTALLFYSIHTGSVFGLPTKILAVVACLVVVAMSVTGVWMWWQRRPPGEFGALRRTNGEVVPRAAVVAVVVLAVFFPLVGVTLVLFWLGEMCRLRIRSVARSPIKAS